MADLLGQSVNTLQQIFDQTYEELKREWGKEFDLSAEIKTKVYDALADLIKACPGSFEAALAAETFNKFLNQFYSVMSEAMKSPDYLEQLRVIVEEYTKNA